MNINAAISLCRGIHLAISLSYTEIIAGEALTVLRIQLHMSSQTASTETMVQSRQELKVVLRKAHKTHFFYLIICFGQRSLWSTTKNLQKQFMSDDSEKIVRTLNNKTTIV